MLKQMLLGIFALLALALTGCDIQSAAPTPIAANTAPTSTPIATTPTATLTGGQILVARVPQAKEFISNLAEGDYARAEESLTSAMKAQMPADKLKEFWQHISSRFGDYKEQIETRPARIDDNDVVFVTCMFARGDIEFRVDFNDAGLILNFYIKIVDSNRPTPTYVVPSYVKQSAFAEKEVQVGSGEWVLPGTLSLPNGNGPFPAVILVHGSGQLDRDATGTLGQNKPFRDLAWGLASQGVAVLRYEKRTMTYSEEIDAILDSLTVKEEIIDDAVAAVSLLRNTDNVDPQKIIIVGHSLGGYVGPRIIEGAPEAAGLVMLAAPSRPLEDVILEQVTYIASLGGSVTLGEQRELEVIKEQVARVKDPALSPDTPSYELPWDLPGRYWLDMRSYKPVEVARRIEKPILVLQGESDYNVTMQDFQGWKSALGTRPNVQFKSYPRLNHLFIAGEGKTKLDEFYSPGNVATEVINDIAAWVKAR